MGARDKAAQRRRALFGRVGKLAKATSMDKDDAEQVLRDIVHDITGQGSTKHLNDRDVGEACRRLDARIAEAKRWKRSSPPRAASRPTTRDGRDAVEDSAALVTREASDALLRLARALGMDQPALQEWIRTRMQSVCEGHAWPQSRGQAIKCHEGLEAMLFRREASQPAQLVARAERARARPNLTEWERTFLHSIVKRRGDVEQKNRGGWHRSWKLVVILGEIEQSRGEAAHAG